MKLSRGLFSVSFLCLVAASANCGDDDDDGASADCNRKCQAANGDHWVCHPTTRACVSLLSEDCTQVVGDDTKDSAVVIGSVLTFTGPGAPLGQVVINGLKLAADELTTTPLPPAPGSDATRPLVFVYCSDNNEVPVANRAAQHLVDAGVPAIIGTNSSGITISIASQVTIPNNVLLFAPTSQANSISSLQDNNLVWRTSTPTSANTEGLVAWASQEQEREIKERLGVDQIKVANIHNGGGFGLDFAISLENDLVMNGKAALDPANAANYLRFDYGDPSNPAAKPLQYAEAVNKVLEQKPHVIYLNALAESPELLFPIENGWTETAYRPVYNLAGGATQPLPRLLMNNDELRRRLFSHRTGTLSDLYDGLLTKYRAKFVGDGTVPVPSTANAYDNAYILSYLIVALGNQPVTGPNLASMFSRIAAPGATVDVGPATLSEIWSTMASGGSVNLRGTSGSLDFDLATGDTPQGVLIECFSKDPATGLAQGATYSGLRYDVDMKTLQGEFGPQCD